MPILLNKISTKGRGGQKSPKSCLRRIRTAPQRLNMSFYFFSGSLDWILVNNNVRPPDLIQDGLRSQKFVVLDLKPKTNYILRITAHNSAGSTVKEFSFTTLNSDGTPLASEGLKKDHHSEFVLPIVLVAFTITSIVLGTRLLLFFLNFEFSSLQRI